MKAKASRKKIGAEMAPAVIAEVDPGADSGRRLEHIATAAYYRAEARGFVPGLEMDDWLEAEQEYDAATEED